MRLTVASEQLKFFRIQSYLDVEHILSDKEIELLVKTIAKAKSEAPHYPEEDLVRSIPLLLSEIRRKKFGSIVSELIGKKPIRWVHDAYIDQPLSALPLLEEGDCGLLLFLTGPKKGNGLFYSSHLLNKDFSNFDSDQYLFVSFTARHLNDSTHPIVFR